MLGRIVCFWEVNDIIHRSCRNNLAVWYCRKQFRSVREQRRNTLEQIWLLTIDSQHNYVDTSLDHCVALAFHANSFADFLQSFCRFNARARPRRRRWKIARLQIIESEKNFQAANETKEKSLARNWNWINNFFPFSFIYLFREKCLCLSSYIFFFSNRLSSLRTHRPNSNNYNYWDIKPQEREMCVRRQLHTASR